MITFVEGLRTSVKNYVNDIEVKSDEGQKIVPYLPWPTAVGLAGHPTINTVQFDEKPYLEFFGGAVVAVDVEGERGLQRIWMPVLDQGRRPIPAAKLDARDINDSISRLRAKAVAMVYGVGLSLHSDHQTDTEAFLSALGVRPDSDLATLAPLVAKKPDKARAPYVKWIAAYTVARVTDPAFSFEIKMFDSVDETGELRSIPTVTAGAGWMVAVTIHYKGRTLTEWLPIMGIKEVQTTNGPKKMAYQSIQRPSVFQWHATVMRCLTRAIACLTGYGLSVYAKEDVSTMIRESSVEEPIEDVVNEILVRIGNIAAIESVALARSDLAFQYAGTKALTRFEKALDEKEHAFKQRTTLRVA